MYATRVEKKRVHVKSDVSITHKDGGHEKLSRASLKLKHYIYIK
jgi:hypothetical protein